MSMEIGCNIKALNKLDLPPAMLKELSKYYDLPIHCAIAVITPAQAAVYANGVNPRDKMPNKIKKYAQMMRDGKWTISQAIYFDPYGKLIDGQNRLFAVIECGIPQPFLVITGMPYSATPCFDDGTPKRAADVYKSDCNEIVAPRWIETIVRRIKLAYTSGGEKEGLAYAVDNYNKFKDAIDLTTNVWPVKPKLIKAPVIGAFARAFVYYGMHKNKALIERTTKLAQRFETKDWNMTIDKPLIELRSWSDQQVGKGCTGGSWSQKAYGMSADVIKSVLENVKWKALTIPTMDPFGTCADMNVPLYAVLE